MSQSNALISTIEKQDGIDRIAQPIQSAVYKAVHGVPKLANVLHGTWMGHPLHAQITDVPIGAWTSGVVLDAIELGGGTRKLRKGADAVHAIGLATALVAAAAGLADWSTTERRARRVGFIHGVMNVAIAGLMGASLVARARGRRKAGIAASMTGFGLALVSAWLGGELSYKLGVGVQSEVEPLPQMTSTGSPIVQPPVGV